MSLSRHGSLHRTSGSLGGFSRFSDHCNSCALQPVLRPKYAALVQDRLYVVEAERPIWPDLAVVKTRSSQTAPAVPVAVLDEPVIFEMSSEEMREPYIEIVETAGNRLITAIEVLSPDNKLPGEGRRQYLKKRKEIRANRANLVEIDLLRAGRTTFKIPAQGWPIFRPALYGCRHTRTQTA